MLLVWSLALVVIAFISGVLGFGGIAPAAAPAARFLFAGTLIFMLAAAIFLLVEAG